MEESYGRVSSIDNSIVNKIVMLDGSIDIGM